MAEKIKVGDIFTYFQKVEVAGIRLTNTLKVGDKISIEGATTNLQQTVDSIQIDRKPVEEATAGQEVGVRVSGSKVRPHDVVYKLVE